MRPLRHAARADQHRSLTVELNAFIRAGVALGQYRNTSKLGRAGLRLLVRRRRADRLLRGRGSMGASAEMVTTLGFAVLAAGRKFGRWAENPPGVHRTADDKLAAAKTQSRKLTKSG